MSVQTPSILETRRSQALPVLEPAEIERLGRFGESKRFNEGEPLMRVGEALRRWLATSTETDALGVCLCRGEGPSPL